MVKKFVSSALCLMSAAPPMAQAYRSAGFGDDDSDGSSESPGS